MKTPGSVGRPRRFDEDAVLDRVVDIFWANGHANTTTRLLEAELSMKQSSIYNAFGSKQQLLHRAVDRYLHQVDEQVVSTLDRADAGEAELLQFLDDLLAWISTDPKPGCLMLNVLAEQASADEHLVEQARQYRERLRTAFVAALSTTDSQDRNWRADALLAGAMGMNLAARGRAEPAEVAAFCDALRSQVQSWVRSTRS